MNEATLAKKRSIERCIKQVRTYYAHKDESVAFADNHMAQDAIATNLQRACEQCIDLANLTIKLKQLGLPKESADSFQLLRDAKLIPEQMAQHLKNMVGFRNVLVHQYTRLT